MPSEPSMWGDYDQMDEGGSCYEYGGADLGYNEDEFMTDYDGPYDGTMDTGIGPAKPSGGFNLGASHTDDSTSTGTGAPLIGTPSENEAALAPSAPSTTGGIFSGRGGGIFISTKKPIDVRVPEARVTDDDSAEDEATKHPSGSLFASRPKPSTMAVGAPESRVADDWQDEATKHPSDGIFASKPNPRTVGVGAPEVRAADDWQFDDGAKHPNAGMSVPETKIGTTTRAPQPRVPDDSHKAEGMNHTGLMTKGANIDAVQFQSQRPNSAGIQMQSHVRPLSPQNAPIVSKQSEALHHQLRENGHSPGAQGKQASATHQTRLSAPASGLSIAHSQSCCGSSLITTVDSDSSRILPVGPSLAAMPVTPTHPSLQTEVNETDKQNRQNSGGPTLNSQSETMRQDKRAQQGTRGVRFAITPSKDSTLGSIHDVPVSGLVRDGTFSTPTAGRHSHGQEPHTGEMVTRTIPAVTPTTEEYLIESDDRQATLVNKASRLHQTTLSHDPSQGIAYDDEGISFGSDDPTNVSEYGGDAMPFEQLYEKFQSDLRDVEELQDGDTARVLDLEVLFSSAFSASLRDQERFNDIHEDLLQAIEIADDAIRKFQNI
jgi:hypothetical protein